MVSPAPPTPPMSESNAAGVASNVFEISDVASRVSVRLLALSRKIKDALKPIEALSKDIAATGAVLNQLGQQLKKDQDVQVGSSTLTTSVEDLVEECGSMFDSIDKALDGNNTGSKAILGLQHHMSIVSLGPQMALLETDLERLKTPLMLMLQILIYAEQLKSREDKSIIDEQQELLKELNEERKIHLRHMQNLDRFGRKSSEQSTIPPVANKELPPTPSGRTSESRDEVPKANKRIWIKDESPPPAKRSPQTGQSHIGTIRRRAQILNRFEDGLEEEQSSLLDMATFLRLTGPDTPRGSSEDTSALSTHPTTTRSRYQARDPVVRGDASELINFFREGFPKTDEGRITPARRHIMPTRHVTAPMTPPPTGIDDEKQQSSVPLPAQFAPMKTHIRSHSAALPSPLGSHPPVRQFDPSRPATTRWPLQAVLAWLEENSFSVEWQATFTDLQIWGSDFVELESGQSIRKMLTVVYPQLARECAATGKGWDQDRERAEGQRLRKLIRELPLDIKYEGGTWSTKPEASTNGVEVGAGAPQQAGIPVIAPPIGRRRATTAPPEDVVSLEQTKVSQPTRGRALLRSDGITALPERDDEDEVGQSIQIQPHMPVTEMAGEIFIPPSPLGDDDNDYDFDNHRNSGVSELSAEWVQKWTVFPPDEIARGRDTAPALFI